MSIAAILDGISAKVAEACPEAQGDYVNEDGLLVCHKCNTPKQCRIHVRIAGIIDEERVVFKMCDCERAAREKEERERAHRDFLLRRDKNRHHGFADAEMRHWTFANDDMSKPQLTQAMRNYVEHFPDFKRKGKGLLLYGDVGTGKTYAACEVANALIDQGHQVLVTNFAKLCNTMQGMFEGRQQYIDSLNRYALLIIDDLAAERDTEYMQEQVYNIIDARYRAGLPMIITTNLSGQQIKNPDSISKERIYSRILERCHPIEVKGADRRRMSLKDNYAQTKDILGM